MVYWCGKPPVNCDAGGHKIEGEVFYDINFGRSWGYVCGGCFKRFQFDEKRNLGVGKGQKFEHEKETGKWLKTAG